MYYELLNNQIKYLIAYLRKSREDIELEKRTGEDTLARHREMLTRIGTQNNWILEFREEVESGDTIASRPVFQRVLEEDMPSGKYQGVLVTEISRLGRGDMQDVGRILNAFLKCNMFIIIPNKIYNLKNSADYRHVRFDLFISREEYEMTKERLESGKIIKAERGEKPYGPNLSYGYSQYRGKVTIIDNETWIVITVFEMRADGKSKREIKDYFNKLGVLTKKGTKWHQHTVSCMLHNKMYLSIIVYKGKEYKGKFPAIVSQELWDRAHFVEDKHSKEHATHILSPYILPLYCGICGLKMHGDTQIHNKVTNPHKVLIYRCKGTHKFNFVKASEAHEIALEKLKKVCNSIETIKQNIKFNTLDTENIINTINQFKKETKTKFKFLEKCRNDYEKGILPAELYAEHWNKIKQEIKLLEDTIKESENKLNKSNMSNPEYIFNIVNEVIKFWDTAENYKKREAVNLVFKRMEYTDKDLKIIL